MSRHGRTKLVPPKPKPENNQALETIEEANQSAQTQEPVFTELDNEIECPRCDDIMELSSSFDEIAYYCENCSFILSASS
jgi:late competence protein required for DNA uptake (superfamily II DNA/RNA helicase)